jgi:hypothetical protein
MTEKLLQVNFRLNVGIAEYRRVASAVCERFAQVPGLKWKIWYVNEDQNEAGGICLFEDQHTLDAFASGRVAQSFCAHPALREVTMRAADVMPDLSAVTRGPVGAAAHA